MNHHLPERTLADKLKSLLSEEFEIIPEDYITRNPGKFNLDGISHKVIPDLILKPKKSLIESGFFFDTIIPVEIKKFNFLETNKFEDLMFQCHTYRMSTFNDIQPKMVLYFIDDYFETKPGNTHIDYDYKKSLDNKNPDYMIRFHKQQKHSVETLFGRFGIGEIVTYDEGYKFRLKRQQLFEKRNGTYSFKPQTLNFWWGNNRNSKKVI